MNLEYFTRVFTVFLMAILTAVVVMKCYNYKSVF